MKAVVHRPIIGAMFENAVGNASYLLESAISKQTDKKGGKLPKEEGESGSRRPSTCQPSKTWHGSRSDAG